MSVGETIIRSDDEPAQDVVELAGSISLLEAAFGDCLVVSTGDPFETKHIKPGIHASSHDVYTGAAQWIWLCGDQSPAYLGDNGPKFD